MNELDKIALLELAKDAIIAKIEKRKPDLSEVKHLTQNNGVFVTLMKNRQLRGGRGVLTNNKNIVDSVIEAAQKAAFEDPRFKPVTEAEAPRLKVEISILGKLEILHGDRETYPDQIDPKKNGLYLDGVGKALILPKTSQMYTPVQYLNSLCQAADLSFKDWKNLRNRIYKFTAETFSE